MTNRGRSAVTAWGSAGLAVSGLSLAGCSGGPVVPAPEPGAGPAEVMALYLKALSVGDCQAARGMEAGERAARDDGLCGRIDVSGYTWNRSPAQPNGREQVFSTQLTATGWDGGMPDGKHTVFFTVQLQDDGSWKVTGGGSGP